MSSVKSCLICIICILTVGIHLQAQIPFRSAFYGRTSGDRYSSGGVLAQKDGSFIINQVYSNKNGSIFFNVTKFNGCHSPLWKKQILIPSNELNNSSLSNINVINDPFDKGFLFSFIGENTQGWQLPYIIKIDSNGDFKWAKSVQIPHSWIPTSLKCTNTPDHGWIVAGSSDSTYPVLSLIYLCKLDSNGVEQWGRKYFSSGFYSAMYGLGTFSIVVKVMNTKDGGYFVCMSNTALQILKIDKYGSVQKFINTSGNTATVIYGAASDDSDNIYMGGGTYGTGDLEIAPILYKFDKDLNKQWAHLFTDSKSWAFNGLALSAPHNILAASNGEFNHKLTNTSPISQIGPDGSLIWERDYHYNNSSGTIGLQFTADSGLIASCGSGFGDSSYIFKTDKNFQTGCGEKNINAKVSDYSFTVSSPMLTPYTGYPLGDTVIKIITIPPPRENISCSLDLIPNANLGADTILCSGQSYTLHKGLQNTGAKTYWSTGDTTDSIVVTKTGKYWLQLSHGYCTSSDTVNVIFKSQIKTGLLKQQSICQYDSIKFKVNDLMASYTGSSLWYWITPKKDTISGDSIIARDSGYYYLMLKGTQCPNVDTVHVVYYPLPKATAGPDTILCRDETYIMQGAGGISYDWIPATYLSSSTDPNATAKLPNTEHYILVVSNKQGCQDTSQVLLSVRPNLSVKAHINNAEVCYGQNIVLTAMAHGGDSIHYKFNWVSDGQTGDSINVNAYESGWHRVVLSDNCTPANVTDSVYVTAIPPAKAAFVYSPATKIKTNHDISFINQSISASSYLWTFGTKDSSKQVTPVYIYTDTGDYEVTLVAYGLNNCPNDTAFGFIKVINDQVNIYIPNAFSPDGNGVNDFFDITGVGIKNYSFNIYNRWGELVYSSPLSMGRGVGGEAGWDGKSNSKDVPEGVYLYTLDVIDVDGIHHYLSGNVTLMR